MLYSLTEEDYDRIAAEFPCGSRVQLIDDESVKGEVVSFGRSGATGMPRILVRWDGASDLEECLPGALEPID